MRVLITGAGGQLGQALQEALSLHTVIPLARADLDVTDRAAVFQTILRARPEVVIHAAAITDVDGCARDPEKAFRVNAMGTQAVALACVAAGAALIYISTNEVFDGTKGEPYLEFDPPNPINPYGHSKWAGEWFVSHLLQRFYIVRTAWVFGPGGNHFVRKILCRADEQGALRVVHDEVGSPSYTRDVAAAIARLIETEAYGIYHFVNEGMCSRYEYAVEILRRTGRGHIPVTPIASTEFPRPSRVPPFTPLRNLCGAALGITLRPWPEALQAYLAEEGWLAG
ncbi:MAG: dTDP-4-dehydrorhamnose reductase [Thermoflexus sp.]|jgi:dTDP-4-dehydrorhamnose reductase|nr:dTDP-4-dehydrorhamnose reductase [Thermoflexus sp.]